MDETFRTRLSREPRNASGGTDMDRAICVLSVFGIEADGIHDGPGAVGGTPHRAFVIDIGGDGFDATDRAGKQQMAAIVTSRGDPNDETGIAQVADNAATEKAGTAKYGRVPRRHGSRVRAGPD